jgi:glutamate N-acetyltransferase/amino-acid N-acetyltransferase
MSVTLPGGFRASGVAAGLKSSGALDVALVVNDGPMHSAAGVFTTNRFQAAPVIWSQQVLRSGQARTVILNSGGANACTGPEGFQDTHRTAEYVADLLECGAGEVVVCSTGLIGERLPMDRLLSGVSAAVQTLSGDGGADAARAIMTTDTVSKTASVAVDGFTVGGMAKGAGMLAPGLATMLVVITTDAVVDSADLQRVLVNATRLSFDRIDSDGCMSTNDSVIALASGASGVHPTDSILQQAITTVCMDLARALIGDAEGSSKDIRVDVQGALSEQDAVEVGRSVLRSNLFKCAVHGGDPNWGRVLSAIGTTAATFDPTKVDVALNGVWICRSGAAGESRDLVSMDGREVVVTIALGAGQSEATLWGNDLTAAYVHENSAYAT